MKWYRIVPCPKYAISEDGQNVLNTERMSILHHKTAVFAKDGLRRVTLYYNKTYRNHTKAYRQAYTLIYLKDNFIKPENIIDIDEHKIIW